MAQGVDENRAIEEVVASLTARLGDEKAGVTCAPMDSTGGGIWLVLGAERVGAAESGSIERSAQHRTKLAGLAEVHKTAKRPFGIRR